MNKEFKISHPDFWHQINHTFASNGGTYQLFCKDENGNTIPSNRLLKSDSDGILYIGKAQSFLDRVVNLKKSIAPNYKSSSHECGARYKMSPDIANMFPYDRLWLILTQEEDIPIAEKKLLANYGKKYGELPPLNRVS